MSSQSSIRDSFFEECEDLLEALNEGLDEIGDAEFSDETVNAVFRAVHSIKGGAGAFGLDALVGFSHRFETVLDAVRSKTLKIDDELQYVLRRAGDLLSVLIEASRDNEEVDEASTEAIIQELNAFLDDDGSEEGAELVFQPLALDFGAPIAAMIEFPREYILKFHPKSALYKNGHEPQLLFRALAELGDLNVRLDHSRLPAFDDLVEGEFYFSWVLTLTTNESEAAVLHVFEFVEGLCDLEISDATDQPTDLTVPSGEEQIARPSVDVLVSFEEVHDPKVAGAETDEAENVATLAEKTRSTPRPTVRVDLDRVDRLINTVGELIINRAMISQRILELNVAPGSDIVNDLEDYGTLAREIQEGVMSIRAQPVKPLFQRMARIVREAGDATGKKIRLELLGEGTEVDKTVIERLADPLTHMIRNAVDHGIEASQKRLAAGKQETGCIRLSAKHRSGSVMIEITDDGAGLNREKIYEIAVRKGLIAQGTELSSSEIDALLFLPGFSTAPEVSSLSGRGVGMDVVKSAVTALGGRVMITSTPGVGTTFTVVLPLTLAVMDGMVVTIANQTMVVPIASILETIRPGKTDIHSLGKEESVLSIRGRYVPIIDVAHCLDLPDLKTQSATRVLILLETEGGGQCAFAVDEIHDQRQVVIKSLVGNYGYIPGVSAATILGDGKIALILDPDAIARSRPNQARQILPVQQETEVPHVATA